MTDELRKELAESELWLSSKRGAGSTVAWAGEDLSDMQMSHAVLFEGQLIATSFDRVVLDGADLSSCTANGASFIDASLIETTFSHAELAETRFDRATAVRARFVKATLSRAVFEGANLTETSLERATCVQTVFTRADLTGSSFEQTNFYQADLRDTNLTRVSFDQTFVDLSTRFDGCRGLSEAKVVSIRTSGTLLEGDEARSWLKSRAAPPSWTLDDLQSYLATEIEGRAPTSAFEPPRAAIDFERVIGPLRINLDHRGSRHLEYTLPRWPDLVFEVVSDRNGATTGIGFKGGSKQLPSDVEQLLPGVWTLTAVRQLASGIVIEKEAKNDVDATVSIGSQQFQARFRYGVLVMWEPLEPK